MSKYQIFLMLLDYILKQSEFYFSVNSLNDRVCLCFHVSESIVIYGVSLVLYVFVESFSSPCGVIKFFLHFFSVDTVKRAVKIYDVKLPGTA